MLRVLFHLHTAVRCRFCKAALSTLLVVAAIIDVKTIPQVGAAAVTLADNLVIDTRTSDKLLLVLKFVYDASDCGVWFEHDPSPATQTEKCLGREPPKNRLAQIDIRRCADPEWATKKVSMTFWVRERLFAGRPCNARIRVLAIPGYPG